MRSRTAALIVSLLCVVLVRGSLAQISKPKAEPAPAQPAPAEPAPSSEGRNEIAKPSAAAPVPAESVPPGADNPYTPPSPPAGGAPPPSARVPHPGARPPKPLYGIVGIYTDEVTQAIVEVKALSEDEYEDLYYVTSSQGWEGVGMLERSRYEGVFRFRKDGGTAMAGLMGQLVIDWNDRDHPMAKMTFNNGALGTWNRRWTKVGEIIGSASGNAGRPAFGDYVQVEELPEAITKVPPQYPQDARTARTQGTVMLQALVVEDGTVADVMVVKGISGLDEAAKSAVRQWRFKPASAKGKPVSVWVAVPVRFSLN